MKKYEIYKITNIMNNNIYIGYTSKGIENRLHKHYANAISGIDTHFYRAIRKYGISKFTYESIDYSFDSEDIKEREKYWIKHYDTFNNGYNMTLGGDGGNTSEKLSPKDYERYILIKSKQTTGENNPNYSGLTDDEIVNYGVEFFISNNFNWVNKKWLSEYCEVHKIPKSFSKFRFDGLGSKEFRKRILSKLHEIGYTEIKEIKYIKTKNHIDKLSDANMNKRWYHNDKIGISKQLYESDLTSDWKLGRKKYKKQT